MYNLFQYEEIQRYDKSSASACYFKVLCILGNSLNYALPFTDTLYV